MIYVYAKYICITCVNVLIGFKWIAEKIRLEEGNLHFVCGGEESYGYMTGDHTRDKDAISSAALICEMAAVAKEEGQTLYEALINLYKEYGLYKERLLSITRKGRNGADEIAEMMDTFRKNPPLNIH